MMVKKQDKEDDIGSKSVRFQDFSRTKFQLGSEYNSNSIEPMKGNLTTRGKSFDIAKSQSLSQNNKFKKAHLKQRLQLQSQHKEIQKKLMKSHLKDILGAYNIKIDSY